MEVMSIADYDQAHTSDSDTILDSAVDQLEAIVQNSANGQMNAFMYSFGDLSLEDLPRPFDFQLPSTYKRWPGPRYGDRPLHKPKLATPERKHRQADVRQDPRPRKSSKPKKQAKPKKVEPAPTVFARVASGKDPVRLVHLPAEIRNLIWALLAVQSDPVEAQLRPIHTCRKLSGPCKGTLIRRFPCEPRVAMVSRQVRREVLSIFYGSNHFIFEKNACRMFKNHDMLNPVMMQKWRPKADVAMFLATVDVRFNALPRLGDMLSVVYQLRRLQNDEIDVSVRVEKTSGKRTVEQSGYCICSEKIIADELAKSDCGGDLTVVAAAVVVKRLDRFFGANPITKPRTVFPSTTVCESCERATFQILYSGI